MNEPAFPIEEIPGVMRGAPGMTMRDYFAAKVLNALIGRYGTDDTDKGAVLAYQYADAMLKARTKAQE